jgi:hypothetical protein
MLPIQDQGEGLDIAADFLNELPYAQDKVATAFRRNAYVFERYYNGRSIREIKPVAAYRVYDLNSMIRDFQEESDWQVAWQQDQSKEPLLTVELDGVSYVWVYGDQPTNPTGDGPIVEVNARMGEHIFLPRVQLNKQQLMAGDELVVMLEWQIDANIEADYTVFTHLLSSQGILVAQQDNVPLLNNRPTFTWGAAEVLRDVHIIHLPADLPPGGYELSAGMYDTGNLELIPALVEAGGRLPGDRIVISTIQIIAPE